MICYRDMTFCAAKCKTVGCPRNFTEEHKKEAKQKKLPVSWADFSEWCDDYDAE